MKQGSCARVMRMEVVVGFFMLAIFIGLGYFTVVLSRASWFAPTWTQTFMFESVMGLRDGDNVVVRGMPIGKIKTLTLMTNGVQLLAVLDLPVHPREGYCARIVNTSMLGGRHLAFDEGPLTAGLMPPGTVLIGEPPNDLMADASEAIHEVKKVLVDDGVLANIRNASVSLNEILDRANSGQGSLGRLLSKDGKLYDDLAASVASLRSVTDKIQKGEGTIGQFVNDDKLYNDIKGTVNEARAALDDVRENTPVVTFSSVLFGAL
jgi:phospholipid/cholesterol/gamma-HCH transport system substrate-binding protein